MSAMNLSMDELCASVLRLLGRTPDDRDVQRFLSAVGCWPIPAFAEERFTYSFEDQQRGFALTFQDAATLPAENKIPGVPARTPVFIGAVLYSEGKDDYHQFAGKIPGGATWADTPSALETKLGPSRTRCEKHEDRSVDGVSLGNGGPHLRHRIQEERHDLDDVPKPLLIFACDLRRRETVPALIFPRGLRDEH